MTLSPEDILNYWFLEIDRRCWFENDRSLDDEIRRRFLEIYEKARGGELASWESTPESALALMLLFNEFPRRMFRGTARAFETDDQALEIARTAIIHHFDDRIAPEYKLLFYLPFLNSENLSDQRLALFYIRERAKENEWLTLAEEHFNIVQQFGRFPQRNPILGRTPTTEEDEFIKHHKVTSA